MSIIHIPLMLQFELPHEDTAKLDGVVESMVQDLNEVLRPLSVRRTRSEAYG